MNNINRSAAIFTVMASVLIAIPQVLLCAAIDDPRTQKIVSEVRLLAYTNTSSALDCQGRYPTL